MTALDTSVCVPALLTWHEHHDACREATVDARLPTHVVVESYSVMTRLPAPHRIDSTTAHRLLDRWTDDALLTAPATLQRNLLSLVAGAGLDGGAVYDALVGLTAAEHDELLLTRDRRAMRTYDRLGVAYQLVESR
ncbi:MAG: type II toxin-antitoxin system VapC family toxin [Acidimicrobiales bacterium]